jgi:membrane-associated phospholipid phosphatase
LVVSDIKHAGRLWGVITFVSCVTVLLLHSLTKFDVEVAAFVKGHSTPQFAEFMSRSLFEGDAFGGGDVVTLVSTFAILLACFLPQRFKHLSKDAAIVAGAALVLGAGVIHPLKQLTDRPRPTQTEATTIGILGHTKDKIEDRASRTSFPSGHTATVMGLATIALLISASPRFRGHSRSFIYIASGCFVSAAAVAMGMARVARGDHWPTDVAASIVLGWIVAFLWVRFRDSQKGRFQPLLAALLCIIFSWCLVGAMKLAGVGFVIFVATLIACALQLKRKKILPSMPTSVYWLIVACTVLRIVIASTFPLTNDEAYYWDWSRSPQLSYLDHPGGVSWMIFLSRQIFGPLSEAGIVSTAFVVRGLAPFFSLVGTLALIAAYERAALQFNSVESTRTRGLFFVAVISQLTPIFLMIGAVALPDSGLYMLLAILVAIAVSLIDIRSRASIRQMFLLGAVAGAAFCFKFHAGFLGLMLCISLVWIRRKKIVEDSLPWCAFIIAGFLCASPVLIWNFQNDWASIAFQTTRRMTAFTFNPLSGGRVLFGQMLAVTPIIYLGAFWVLTAKQTTDFCKNLRFFTAMLILPMVTMFALVAFYRESLPHWVGPAFFLVVPFLVLLFQSERSNWGRGKRVTIMLAVFLLFSLPVPLLTMGFGIDRIESKIVSLSNGDPGPMQEVTLWSRLAPAAQEVWTKAVSTVDSNKDISSQCRGHLAIASMRWYSAAQLAFHLPGQPNVRSIDPNHRSFYSYRDRALDESCPLLVVANAATVDEQALKRDYIVMEKGSIVVSGHEGIPFSWFLLQKRILEDQEAFSWIY